MKQLVNFTPGPSQLYFTVFDHVKNAFKDGIPSLSHRSKEFEAIFSSTTNGLRELLNIPASSRIFFTGSATEIWERIIQNLVEEKSFHLVNGSFSKRFYEIGIQLNKKASKVEVAPGTGFRDGITIAEDNELIAVTHNETSTGVSMPIQWIEALREKYPNQLIVVDAVSSLPYPAFDYSKVDSVFFSVQKGFGLPAGLGVWIVNEKCLEKNDQLILKGISTGSYHNLTSLHEFAKKNQTPETPNVLGIYLLGKVVQDFLRRGIDTLRRETEYKASLLYHTLEKHDLIDPFVAEKSLRSKTVIVAECKQHTPELGKFLAAKGLSAGDGYGPAKKTQLRFANFPAHSKETYEQLADTIAAFGT